ncbi:MULTISPECIES: LLM class flavin-dependent oxidoreductase [unclassified Kitasatospora]|uniref:LLM class flavin-dependent oxidoreductase n=1 Tax=unclassified Kitasatospora TaxID=2633591 RepID=UPI003807A5D6
MRFGCFISPLHPIGEDPTLLYQRDLEFAQVVDSLNYEELWIGEHHSAGWGTIPAPELLIAAAAERTRRIKFATGVTALPYHHPFLVAERAMHLDHMTRGRFILGGGAGSVISDMHMFGIAPEDTRERTAQAMETIVALLAGETVTRDEGWFRLVDARLQLGPFSPGGPEVTVASAATPFGVQLAGRLGISVLSHAAPPWGAVRAGHSLGIERLADQWRHHEEAAAEAGRQVSRDDWRLVIPVHVARTREEALEDIREGWLRQRDELWIDTIGLPMSRNPQSGAKAFEATVAANGIIVGDVEDVVGAITKLQEVTGGFGTLLISCQDWAPWPAQLLSVDLFARFVVPRFRGTTDRLRASNAWAAANRTAMQEAGFAARNKAMAEHGAPDGGGQGERERV